MTVLSSFPGVLALLALVALLVWLGVATRGRVRVLALVGVGLELLSLVVGILPGILLPLLRDSLPGSTRSAVLLVSGVSSLLSTAGIVLLVLAVVTASRAARAPQVPR
jgi:hypothetical protein